METSDFPPILNEIITDLENYLLCPESLPIHQYEKNQEFWPRKPNPKQLLHFEGSPLCSTLKVQRDPNTGEIVDFKEVLIEDAGATACNSMSFNRAPAPPGDAVWGTNSYIPFWPGSFPRPVIDEEPKDLETELLTVPPGFQRGLVFDEDGVTVLNHDGFTTEKRLITEQSSNVVNLLDLVQHEQELLGVFDTIEKEAVDSQKLTQATEDLQEEDIILSTETPLLKISETIPLNEYKSREWAVLLDTSKPVVDFHKKIPQMAIEFPFELDNFQKLAILELEQHNHVFVAAHTSAGKTVVADYAIALSLKHMTRTIYTSPIKALSNQKYRDFKKSHKDVGLITGDFQINQTASCLIMTTEILRTMLYCGSDVTRDLEYVIFDEVHYVNDRERGHVWEQVLILLPAQVCVILLSATVPNTVEFADWLGRTHKRKVYVVTTSQRPVPLQHFLYTGQSGPSRDNRHMILDRDTWKRDGFFQAKKSMSEEKVQERGPLTPKQEKTYWTRLVDHLKRKDLLPVVAFTFSRQKCDNNSSNLSNLDLTTQNEKGAINLFFDKCVKCLKEPDQKIPQIVKMRDILTRGVGVHHSGVLPIVKEIVEILFQRGLIKLLFATETFAMGVNMPARTVVFDSVRKHDGKELRDLKPAEYIQMAGRAGRRGHDDQGTVIILCKRGLLPEENLKQMMLGKPSSLESQFRLTYGMILSLLRVKSLGVEDMMSRSFREVDHQKNLVDAEIQLTEVNRQLEEINQQQLSSYLQPLADFFKSANGFLEHRKKIMNQVFDSSEVQKILTPGKILLITHKHHVNKLALVLTVNRSKKSYDVLVLSDATPLNPLEETKDALWYQMLSLALVNIFLPASSPSHEIITVTPEDVFEISAKTLKINTDIILQDWRKRQIERFRFDPPGQTCLQAVQELQKLTMLANDGSNCNKLEFLHFINDLKLNDITLYENLQEYYYLKDKLIDYLPSTQIPNFEQQFSSVFKRKFLEEKFKDLQFQMSSKSLTLFEDYENIIELLRRLKYVDMQKKVELKGKVACEMRMCELLITELVVRNILTKLKPAEVAALLSALVFRVKIRGDQLPDLDGLTEDLKQGIEQIKTVHKEIADLERALGVQTDEFQEELNFGLVHVVYEWTSGKPFAEIMELTEIQEGIIVRCIQQLNETICDVRNAARIVGDPELRKKMEEASTAIKRDIVFAASLYTHEKV